MTDVVYVVRFGEHNEELRYSLRSLQNLPHGEVFLAGHQPRWVRNVTHLPVARHFNKFRSAEINLSAAINDDRVSDPFYLFNDDFYVMQPIAEIPVLHRGPVGKLIAEYSKRFGVKPYVQGMQQTYEFLQTVLFEEPLSYEMHTPLLVDKQGMQDVLGMRGKINNYHLRTVYGNMLRIGGTYSEDVKVYPDRKDDYTLWPLLSTSDAVFRRHLVGEYIRGMFPDRGTHE